MSAAEAPSSWATFSTSVPSSAAASLTARSNSIDFSGNLRWVVQRLLLDRAEDRFHAMGNPNHDSRTDPDSFRHDEPVSRFRDD